MVVNDGDATNLLTRSDIGVLKNKIYLLRKAYQLAIQFMEPNSKWTWEAICKEAIQEIKSAINCTIKSYKTRLGQYNIEFRTNETFRNPNLFGGPPREYPPKLLLKLPDAKQMLGACFEFQNELTALQTLGKDLGVAAVISPKFHAELAGEGIEYLWAFAKG